MNKVDSTIKTETKNIAKVVLILSALLEAVYLIIGQWNYTVLLGNLLGGGAGILNFFLMGLGLQSAIKKDVADAKTTVKFSHTYRFIILGAVMVIGIFVPVFDMVSTIASVFFSSFGIYIRFFLMKKKGVQNSVATVAPTDNETTDNETLDEEVSES